MGWSCKQFGNNRIFGFQNIKIPVYAGFTYQPEITITKPERPLTRDLTTIPGFYNDRNRFKWSNLTDEFNAGNYWVNSLNTSVSPVIPSTTSVHYFRQRNTLTSPLIIPAGTTSGEKLMRDSYVPFSKRNVQCKPWAYI
jgi:hypothetical protein